MKGQICCHSPNYGPQRLQASQQLPHATKHAVSAVNTACVSVAGRIHEALGASSCGTNHDLQLRDTPPFRSRDASPASRIRVHYRAALQVVLGVRKTASGCKMKLGARTHFCPPPGEHAVQRQRPARTFIRETPHLQIVNVVHTLKHALALSKPPLRGILILAGHGGSVVCAAGTAVHRHCSRRTAAADRLCTLTRRYGQIYLGDHLTSFCSAACMHARRGQYE